MPTDLRVLEDFEGAWHIERHIVPATGPAASFEGQGIWTPCAEGLIYHEKGVMRLPDLPAMQAERRYLWCHDLRVQFDDGRPFHTVPAMGGPVQHQCDPDHYEGDYDFSEWPQFVVRWHVTGPRKDYRMTSRYMRA